MASAYLGVPTEAEFDQAVLFIYDLLGYCLTSLGKDWEVMKIENLADIQEREMERRPHSSSTITWRFGHTVLELHEKYKEHWNTFIQKHGEDIFSDGEDFDFFLERFSETNFDDSFLRDFLKYCIFVVNLAIHCYDSGKVCYVDNILWFTKPLLTKLFISGKLLRFDAQQICHDLGGHYFEFEF